LEFGGKHGTNFLASNLLSTDIFFVNSVVRLETDELLEPVIRQCVLLQQLGSTPPPPGCIFLFIFLRHQKHLKLYMNKLKIQRLLINNSPAL
jgi:hypothetical protein